MSDTQPPGLVRLSDPAEVSECSVRLAIADPPYPPFVGAGGRKNRASRWYGDGQRSVKDQPADRHPEAAEWDDPARHRRLLLELLNQYDGWAIATSPDGIAAYGNLPAECRIMAWIRPNAAPGSHRLRSLWEPVILFPPAGRRSNRNGAGCVPDVLTAALGRRTFIGAKPPAWVEWVLDALGYDPETDRVDDLFPGSGVVAEVLRNRTLPFSVCASASGEQNAPAQSTESNG